MFVFHVMWNILSFIVLIYECFRKLGLMLLHCIPALPNILRIWLCRFQWLHFNGVKLYTHYRQSFQVFTVCLCYTIIIIYVQYIRWVFQYWLSVYMISNKIVSVQNGVISKINQSILSTRHKVSRMVCRILLGRLVLPDSFLRQIFIYHF